ncbi:MAG: carbohydrate ABC transporter permease [Chloroflexi bacterium]|nr:carbohydrate ABC transporter permease [Chloroflexota bacterium]
MSRSGRDRIDTGLLLFGLLMLAALMLLPLLWWVSLAFQDTAGLRAPTTLGDTWIPDGLYLFDNLAIAMRLTALDRLVLNSVVVTASITALEVTLATLAGYALAHVPFPGRGLVFVGVVILLSVPQLVLIIPLFQLIAALDWVNSYQGIILPYIVTPFGVFMMRQLLLHIPRPLLEAARIDGASELRIFLRIVVPLSRNAMLTLGIFTFFLQFDNLLWPLIAATDEAMHTLPVGFAALNTNIATPFNALFAVTLVVSLPFLVVYLFAQRRIMASFATSGLRE